MDVAVVTRGWGRIIGRGALQPLPLGVFLFRDDDASRLRDMTSRRVAQVGSGHTVPGSASCRPGKILPSMARYSPGSGLLD